VTKVARGAPRGEGFGLATPLKGAAKKTSKVAKVAKEAPEFAGKGLARAQKIFSRFARMAAKV